MVAKKIFGVASAFWSAALKRNGVEGATSVIIKLGLTQIYWLCSQCCSYCLDFIPSIYCRALEYGAEITA